MGGASQHHTWHTAPPVSHGSPLQPLDLAQTGHLGTAREESTSRSSKILFTTTKTVYVAQFSYVADLYGPKLSTRYFFVSKQIATNQVKTNREHTSSLKSNIVPINTQHCTRVHTTFY